MIKESFKSKFTVEVVYDNTGSNWCYKSMRELTCGDKFSGSCFSLQFGPGLKQMFFHSSGGKEG